MSFLIQKIRLVLLRFALRQLNRLLLALVRLVFRRVVRTARQHPAHAAGPADRQPSGLRVLEGDFRRLARP